MDGYQEKGERAAEKKYNDNAENSRRCYKHLRDEPILA
jgi:hypothetical protein